MVERTRRAENAAATRDALVDAARELFAEHGYTAVSTEQVVRAARVTRGALYHHFADKRELMEAVFASVDHALVARVRQRVEDEQEPWKALELTITAFFDELGRDPTAQRIIFTEAPAALGWARWRELDGGRSLILVVERLSPRSRRDSSRRATPLPPRTCSLARSMKPACSSRPNATSLKRAPQSRPTCSPCLPVRVSATT